jgi:hypothetical protein
LRFQVAYIGLVLLFNVDVFQCSASHVQQFSSMKRIEQVVVSTLAERNQYHQGAWRALPITTGIS